MAKSVEELKHLTTQIRRDILRMVHAVNSGHPGGSLGCVEYFTALYGKVMNYSLPFKMEGKNEDLFFLSNGHISPVYYSTLARFNFFPVEELATFRKLDTRLQGHPTTHEGLPGVRIASGSLGQGLSVAVGAALGKKLDGDKGIVFSLHGDGELQEGQIWEALMYASHNKVDNLIATIDYNNRQIDGDVSDVLSLGNLKAKLEAFDWQVLEVKEGNNLEAVIAVLEEAKAQTGKGKPIAIIMHTEMGNGVDFMMGTHAWHGKAPNDEQLEKALAQLSTDNLADY
ncbi:transketolase [Riemerella anatipestifer]|uniref:Transketolase domain-containing protein n=2 Tax=Riemerella anatipestifer TaxID=34085 RepID=E4T952_RIEAD|nr:transketolase [Riemerella anatipestifer]ADQ81533.1 Transketolase domain-containing protein [Riemerella anatipestifer ATCC 11845 = DSM 15868]ADZ12975.1 Transketolase, N-terminal subunit [Riemerella anatipestifer RA-GD]AFD55549.1 transketolase domain-containing protein [Riemerella anatipestifer ATCC 11845 = DSM 15868]AGC40568.1 Transketolase, N-terminal subunit [Riemerella anatipestifer RA-CH-2]AKP68797.1 transketolase domain-containing protein [Riemerella anatipestifer]